MTYGIIGLGTMGSAVASALVSAGRQVIGTTHAPATATAAAARLGIEVGTDNVALARASDVIVLGVKQYQAREVVQAIAPELDGKLLISVCAAVTTADIRTWSGDRATVVRAMPNTPAQVSAGVTALCAGRFVSAEQMRIAQRIFATVGRTVVVDEKHMDAVTGLSGSGPAFLYIIIEALAEAGVNVGLPRDVATMLAAQTAYGSARMVLETGYHPALLKDAVTTPAGTTVDGILALEEGGLRATLINAVKRATERAKELAAG